MPAACVRLPSLVALFAVTCASAPFAVAQVPVGSAVVGTASGPSTSGTAGVFLVALPGGVVTPVTGLPSYLQSTGPTPTEQGVGSVAFRSSDGAIVVGTVAAAAGPAGGNVELFLFYLNGSAVDPTRTRQILLGTTTFTAGAWVAVLPDDRILVVAGPFLAGPMANSPFAIVDVPPPSTPPSPPTFTLLPTPTLPAGALGGGVAIDPTGRFLYMPGTMFPGLPTMVAYLYRHELATSLTCTIASWPGQLAQGVCCDDDGTVYVSASSLSTLTHAVHAVRPNGCTAGTVTTTATTLSIAPSGLTLDRASGQFLVPSAQFAPGLPVANRNKLWLVDPATGAATFVAGSSGGWGAMSRSIAGNNAIDSYGPRSDGLNHYGFANFPNPGGQPGVGNLNFSLTMRSDPALPQPLLSVLALSLGRGSLQALGIEVLVDLTTLVLPWSSLGMPTPYGLQIANNPGLVGFQFTAQSVHLENGGTFAASRGLAITIR